MYFVINIISCDIRMNICNIAWLLYILRKEVLKLVDRKIIYFEDKEYPLELKRLKQPPQQLYVIGNTELLKGENTKIAIVGTRKNTEYGKYMALNFSKKLRDEILSYGTKNNINGVDYYIYVQKDTSGQKSAIANSAILILGCVFLTGSIVFLVIADIIVKPLTRLTNALKELSNGNYDVRVDNVGQDEISKLNQGFNQMARQLAKQDETRQKFISDISHEFQTPLTSIQGFANILKEEDLPKEQRVKYANIILYNSKRLSSLAKNMLQLTLLDREEIELEISTYSLIEQMNRVISTQENQAMEKNIEIEFQVPKKDIVIDGDEQRLEQVWTNIVSNAIKYTNDGGLITISMKKTSKEVEVSIEDTGIGMSKEVVSHIFERFYRVDKSRSKQTGGTGLGLAIVKHIAVMHKAELKIESELGKGTEIKILFNA